MNQEQLLGQFRTFLAAFLAYQAAKHLDPDIVKMLPNGWATTAAVILAGLPSAAWSWWQKRPHALAKQAVAVLQDHPLLAVKVSNLLAPTQPDQGK